MKPIACASWGGATASRLRAAEDESGPLSGGQGSVLDPIVAIRYRLVLEPDCSATIDMVTGIGEDRDAAVRIVEKYQDKRFVNRAFELARTHSQMVLQQINGNESDAQLYGRLAGSVLFTNSGLRAESNILAANRRGQSGLWGYSISGDLPIVLLLIKDPANMAIVRQMVQAHAYWRQKGLAVDLVIWNEEHGGYRQQLQDQILALVTAGVGASVVDRPGGIFIRSADQISGEDRILIQSAARAVISDALGTLEDQVGGRSIQKIPVPRLIPSRVAKNRTPTDTAPRSDLLFFNGLGGFTPGGDEYVIVTARGRTTPAPWVNVIANPQFGTVVSEAGAAYTWSENAHEFRLTPWGDDPVGDASGEALYIRDEESGQFWSPTPLPRAGDGPYVARHGFGYSVFEHSERGIASELWVYVAMDAPVKFSALKIRNESGRTRRLSATSYIELVLGDLRSKSAMHVVTEADAETGAILSRNWFSAEFAGRVVFLDLDDRARTFTCDRAEFIGRNGSLRNPAAMSRTALSGKAGAALDPCAALQLPFELADGQECEIVFRLGAGRDVDEANRLIRRFRSPGAARGRSRPYADFGARPCPPCRWKLPTPLSTYWPTAGFCTKCFPAAYGRAAATISPAEPSASAISCRMSWRSSMRSRASFGSSSFYAPPTSSRRAMSSTGGTLPADGALGHAAPTITCGSLGRVALRFRYGRRRSARRDDSLHRGAAGQSSRGFLLRSADHIRAERQSVRALPPGDSEEHGTRRAWTPPHRIGGLERRHEPGGRAGQGRKRMAGLLPPQPREQ